MTNDQTSTDAELERRRQKLRFRCWHRGTREMDLLLGSFADAVAPTLEVEELARFERLLEEGDPDLYDWIGGRAEPPADLDGPLLRRLMAHKLPPQGG